MTGDWAYHPLNDTGGFSFLLMEGKIKYTNILHNERRILNLSLSEYCIADAVYHLQNSSPDGVCDKSREWMADEFGLGVRTVKEQVDRLVEKGFLIKTVKGHLQYTVRWALVYTMHATELEAQQAVCEKREMEKEKRARVRNPHSALNEDGVQNPHSDSAESAPDTVQNPHFVYTTIYNNIQPVNTGADGLQNQAEVEPQKKPSPARQKRATKAEYTERDVAAQLEMKVQAFYTHILNDGTWTKWLDYKAQVHKFKYANAVTHSAAVVELYGFCNGDETIAAMIVNRSIAKQWKGLFKLENSKTNADANVKFTGHSGSEWFSGFKG